MDDLKLLREKIKDKHSIVGKCVLYGIPQHLHDELGKTVTKGDINKNHLSKKGE